MQIHSGFLVAITLIFSSCGKDKDSNDPGQATATFNGSTWTAKASFAPSALASTCFNLAFRTYSSQGFLRQELTVLNIPRRVGLNRVWTIDFTAPSDSTKVGCHLATLIDDGDILCDKYRIVSTDTAFNRLEVQQYDLAGKRVSGSFNLKFAVSLPKCNPSAPDTILLTNGQFSTKP